MKGYLGNGGSGVSVPLSAEAEGQYGRYSINKNDLNREGLSSPFRRGGRSIKHEYFLKMDTLDSEVSVPLSAEAEGQLRRV